MLIQLTFILIICFDVIQMNHHCESAKRHKRQFFDSSSCTVTPEATEGPYYWNSTVRQNITDRQPGVPLRLFIKIVDTNNCTPIANALVDLWHCDAMGIYSHYVQASQGIAGAPNDNETFLRGLALTDANGTAIFDTIYPGWYIGRATHIHVKVHIGSNVTNDSSGTYSGGHVSHTGQLFFDDSVTDTIASAYPYLKHDIVRTRNSVDRIYSLSNGWTTLVLIEDLTKNNFTGAVTLVVNSSATPAPVGGGEEGPGIGQIPVIMPTTVTDMTTTTTTVRGAATHIFISLSTILFVLFLNI